MARDKKRDDLLFNCSQDHEITYVAGLYSDKAGVIKFLKENCRNGTIKNFTHMEVYKLIKKELGYPIPVS